MNGKGDCAKENDNIPFVNGKSPAAHTQQIQPATATTTLIQSLIPAFLCRNRERTGTRMIYIAVINPAFPTVVYLNTDLLQIAGYKQYHTAGNTSGQESLSLRSPALRRFLPGDRVLRSASASSPKNCDHRQQKSPARSDLDILKVNGPIYSVPTL